MTTFLTSVESPVVIYCDPQWEEKMLNLRKGKELATLILPTKFEDLDCASPEFMEYWEKDHARDTEKSMHNTNLYVVWNEKSAMVHRAIAKNPFGTEFYMWCDIGYFRNVSDTQNLNTWPSKAFLETASKEHMYLLNIEPFKMGELDIRENGLTKSFEQKCRIGGGIFLGHKYVWGPWVTAYYQTLKDYMHHNYFAGKDQNILATVVARHPHLVRLVMAPNANSWFYLHHFFNK
jgi:hypothetical protein